MNLKGTIVKRNFPRNFAEHDIEYFSHELQIELSEAKIYTLKGVLLNNKGFLFSLFGVLKQSYLYGNSKQQWAQFRLLVNIISGRRKIIKEHCIAWISDSLSFNYFHWMCDCLPRLLNIVNKINNNIDFVLVLPENLLKMEFVTESLDLLGYKSKAINDDQYLVSDTVLISESIAVTGNYDPLKMKQLRNLFLTRFLNTLVTVQAAEKIYISRKFALRRKVKNEDLVEFLMIKNGFKIFYFENLTFKEQLFICSMAKYLVSIHGAGLTNMLFMPQGGSVLELRLKNDTHNNCYFSLCSALDLSYYYQLCDAFGNDTYDADIEVNLDILQNNLNFMLETNFVPNV